DDVGRNGVRGGTGGDDDAVLVADRVLPQVIGADEVEADGVVVGGPAGDADADVVAGDDVAVLPAADPLVVRAAGDGDAGAVAQGLLTGAVGADEVALDPVILRPHAVDLDADVQPGDDIASALVDPADLVVPGAVLDADADGVAREKRGAPEGVQPVGVGAD